MDRWLFPIKRVKQVDWNGCGIAAVATACGVTYERARSEFFPRREKFIDDRRLRVNEAQMLRVIDALGFQAKPSGAIFQHKRPAIVTFSWNPKNDPNVDTTGVHAVVWNPWQKRFIDPGTDYALDHPNSKYINLWKQSGFRAIIITGKKERFAA